MRGIYFEDWDPTPVVDTVVQALRRHITEGEWEDVRANLPKDLAAVLP